MDLLQVHRIAPANFFKPAAIPEKKPSAVLQQAHDQAVLNSLLLPSIEIKQAQKKPRKIPY